MRNLKNLFVAFLTSLLLSHCASKPAPVVDSPAPVSKQAIKAAETICQTRMGKEKRADIEKEYGAAKWCEDRPCGSTTCIYSKDSEPTELVFDFDPDGVLRGYRAQPKKK